ncbi:hypothetical protein CRYUN_Cryun07bG0127000 [Craigia yunnanensis]
MSSSREDSPDWLRSFQAPTFTLTLSSVPILHQFDSPLREEKLMMKTPFYTVHLHWKRVTETIIKLIKLLRKRRK